MSVSATDRSDRPTGPRRDATPSTAPARPSHRERAELLKNRALLKRVRELQARTRSRTDFTQR